MSPLKVRAVVRQIQGMHALEAQALLASVPRKSARLVSKTLKSAMANAENIADEWDAVAGPHRGVGAKSQLHQQ